MALEDNPTILIDADGVLADFDTGLATKLKLLYPDIEIPDRSNHDIRLDYPEHLSSVIQDIIHSDDFFNEIPIYNDALEGWETLLTNGYQPVICTAPLPDHPRSIEAKQEWIRDNIVPHFGASALNLAQITIHKHTVPALAIIDDSPVMPNAHLAQWRHIIFSQPYNVTVETDFRINGWRDKSLADTVARAIARPPDLP